MALDLVDSVSVEFGWGFQPDSELSELFSYHLMKMEEHGIMKEINDVRFWFSIKVKTTTSLFFCRTGPQAVLANQPSPSPG